MFLFKNGIDVYEGGAFHQTPLLLIVFSLLPTYLFPVLFIAADYVIARCLVHLAQFKLDTWKSDWPDATIVDDQDGYDNALVGTVDGVEDELSIPKPAKRPFKDPLEDESLLPKDDPTIPIDIPIVPSDIGAMYLLNPLSIMTCSVMNTQLFSTLSMAVALLYASKGQRRASMLALSVGTYLTLYPFLLVAPCILFLNLFNEKKRALGSDQKVEALTTTIFKSIGGLVCYTSGFMYLSFLLMGNWTFLKSTYGVM